MQKKIYVAGMFDDESAKKVEASVKAVTGVSSATANPAKAQVLVDFDESNASTENAINDAISSCGVEVLA